MNRVDVKVKKLHPDAVIPKYSHVFDSGFDLVSVEDVIVEPGQTVKVPTGLAFAIPPGYELQIRPRSGISSKTKLRVSNAPGTVDAGYRGEVAVLVDNIYPDTGWNDVLVNTLDGKQVKAGGIHWEGTYLIRKGDRIAQGVIAPVYQARFEEEDELDETGRGAGGFGSSGVRAEVSG